MVECGLLLSLCLPMLPPSPNGSNDVDADFFLPSSFLSSRLTVRLVRSGF